jgi:hypothetical protein
LCKEKDLLVIPSWAGWDLPGRTSQSELFKLAPEDVLTTEASGKLLAPFIKPLPSFYEMVLDNKTAA